MSHQFSNSENLRIFGSSQLRNIHHLGCTSKVLELACHLANKNYIGRILFLQKSDHEISKYSLYLFFCCFWVEEIMQLSDAHSYVVHPRFIEILKELFWTYILYPAITVYLLQVFSAQQFFNQNVRDVSEDILIILIFFRLCRWRLWLSTAIGATIFLMEMSWMSWVYLYIILLTLNLIQWWESDQLKLLLQLLR